MEERLTRFKDAVTDLIGFMVERGRHLDAFDWLMAKSCIFSMGILVCTMFTKFFKKIRFLIAIVFIGTWVYSMLKIFKPVIDDLRGR